MLLWMPTEIPIVRGRGMQPGVDLTDNAALGDLMDSEDPEVDVLAGAGRRKQ